jgi:hypothetical protein
MNTINNVEKFSKCTNLCKPHESNKILWEIKKNYYDGYVKKISDKFSKINSKLKHKDFI